MSRFIRHVVSPSLPNDGRIILSTACEFLSHRSPDPSSGSASSRTGTTLTPQMTATTSITLRTWAIRRSVALLSKSIAKTQSLAIALSLSPVKRHGIEYLLTFDRCILFMRCCYHLTALNKWSSSSPS